MYKTFCVRWSEKHEAVVTIKDTGFDDLNEETAEEKALSKRNTMKGFENFQATEV